MAERCASAISRAENFLARNPSRASAKVRKLSSATRLLHHLRHHEKSVLGLRRVGEHAGGVAAVAHLVLAERQLHWRHRSHRLDTLDIGFLELLDEAEDRIDLAPQVLDLAFCDG